MKYIGLALFIGAIALGAFWAGSRLGKNGSPAGTTQPARALYYVDPMNPAHTSQQPGLAPCGMKMEPVFADSAGSAPLPPGTVKVSPEKQQLIGVRLFTVEKTAGTRALRTSGKVVPDEALLFRMAASVDGWVRGVGPIVTGGLVKKDEVLATFYNRDFLTAQQTYLYALNTMDRFKDNESQEQLKLTRAQMRAAEENLEFLGMGEIQIHEIARTREIAKNIELRAPSAGLVLTRDVFPGLRFERGTELFRIVQLDHVWVMADLFGNHAAEFQPAMTARVTPIRGHQTYEAKVSPLPPQFDSATRALGVRLEVENPEYFLRPDMFVDVELTVNYPSAIVIPSEAVLDTGLRKTVFVERGPGLFEPRLVEAGWRADEQVEICSGLLPGERVVVSGNFLLDSESRMKLAASALNTPAIKPHPPAQPGNSAARIIPLPATASKDPVCGMSVAEAKARDENRFSEHNGKTYFFCSDACKEEFEEKPATYLIAATPKTAETAPAGFLQPGRRAKLHRD